MGCEPHDDGDDDGDTLTDFVETMLRVVIVYVGLGPGSLQIKENVR